MAVKTVHSGKAKFQGSELPKAWECSIQTQTLGMFNQTLWMPENSRTAQTALNILKILSIQRLRLRNMTGLREVGRSDVSQSAFQP